MELIFARAAVAPDAPAIRDPVCGFSYGGLADAVREAAAWLETSGVGPGHRVLLVGENTCGLVVLMLATQRLRAWPAIANARLPLAEIEALRHLVRARITIAPTTGSEAAERLAAEARMIRANSQTVGEIAHDAPSLEAVAEPTIDDPVRRCGLMLFTSGTTGRPKAVMCSVSGLGGLGHSLALARGLTPEDAVTGAAPLSHIMGVAVLAYTFAAGARIDLIPRLEIAELATRVAAGRMTQISLVPTAYAKLLDYVAAHGVDIGAHRLSYISSGGAPLDPALKSRVEAAFGLPLVNAYGLTECAPIARSRPRWGVPADSVGLPEPGVEVKVVGPDGRRADTGETGELVVRTPWTMMGYYGDAKATAAVLDEEGWFATGDLARLSDDGSITLTGRAKELIIRSGFNVYPVEVEAAINDHAGIVHSAVVGVRARDGNEEVVAFVQVNPGTVVMADELARHVRSRLAAYKVPTQWHFVDRLPLGPTGKILKRSLAARASL